MNTLVSRLCFNGRGVFKVLILSHCFWCVLSFIFAGLWLWSLLRRHGEKKKILLSVSTDQNYIEVEDALKAAYRLHEKKKDWDSKDLSLILRTTNNLAKGLIDALIDFNWAEKGRKDKLHLTENGKQRGNELIRAHRLWEKYLVARRGMALDEVHSEAHRMEHEITSEELEKLDNELGYPAWDPHGQFIPGPDGQTISLPTHSLSEAWESGSRMRIVSLNDEFSPLLAQLVALGLKPGVDVELVNRKQNILSLRIEDKNIPIAETAANHIFVVPSPILPIPLGELPVGSRAKVTDIQGGGKHQRRMLDMGFVPGAEISVIRKAPLGDPAEYRVKGTTVALRQKDADTILVEELDDK